MFDSRTPHRSHSARRSTSHRPLVWAMALISTLVLSAGFAPAAEAQFFGQGDPAAEAAVEDIIQDFMAEKQIPGMTVAAAKDGKMVLERSYGLQDKEAGLLMFQWHRTRMGSLSKMLTALTFMKYMEDTLDPGLLDRGLYGFDGILSLGDYPDLYGAMTEGWQRQTPVVGTMISKFDDRVYTYYDNGQYSIGTTSDLDAYSGGLLGYSLPVGQEPQDIKGMAWAANGGFVFTWYKDGTVSYGNPDNLGAGFTTDVDLPSGQSMDFLVGIGIAGTSGRVYAWWEDGTRTVGQYDDLDAHSDLAAYNPAPGQSPYTIRSIAISKSDKVYTFYTNGKVTRGTSRDLDRYRGPYPTELPPQIQPEPWPSWLTAITPRHLLNHSAGFQKTISLTGATVHATDQLASDGYDSDLGMALFHEYGLTSGRMLFFPGSQNNYSNHGGALAGFALEAASGVPFKTLLDSTILDPMSIQMGLAWVPTIFDSGTHWDNNKNDPGEDPDVVNCNCTLAFNFRAQSGYLTSTAGDFLRVMMTMDLASPPHRRVLSDASIALMETPGPAGGYGLGWRIRDAGGWLDHGGSLKGGGSAVVRFKGGYVKDGVLLRDVTVVVMGNLDTPVRELAEDVAMAISQVSVNPNYDIFDL